MRAALKQVGLVAAIFTVLGFLVTASLFSNAPHRWSGAIQSGLAAGAGGILGWALMCGNRVRPAWWRTILAGILAGVLTPPIYLLLASGLADEWLGWSDFVAGSLFLLLIAGVITVPSGIIAATVCRIAGAWQHRSPQPSQSAELPIGQDSDRPPAPPNR